MTLRAKESMNRKRRIVLILLILLTCTKCLTSVTYAAGLTKEVESNGYEYSKYDDENYSLDLYTGDSNIFTTISDTASSILNTLINAIWGFVRTIANFTSAIIAEVYKLDFLSEFANKLGENIQTFAGVNSSGVGSNGLVSGFLPIIILVVGVYVTYTGLFKRQPSKALGAFVNLVVIFVLSVSFFGYAPSVIEKVTEFSRDVNTAVLSLGSGIAFGETNENGDDTELLVNSMWKIQVKEPWLILEFGNTDIDSERIEAIVSNAPNNTERDTAVENEVNEHNNENLKPNNLASRLGTVLIVLIVDLVISVFVLMLMGIMLFSQLLFILQVTLAPFVLVLGMFPSQSGKIVKYMLQLFNLLLVRSAMSIIVTVAFALSSMVYSVTANTYFLFTAFLQIILFAGVFANINKILGLIGLSIGDSQQGAKQMMRGIKQAPRKAQRSIQGVSHGVQGIKTGIMNVLRMPNTNSPKSNTQESTSDTPVETSNTNTSGTRTQNPASKPRKDNKDVKAEYASATKHKGNKSNSNISYADNKAKELQPDINSKPSQDISNKNTATKSAMPRNEHKESMSDTADKTNDTKNLNPERTPHLGSKTPYKQNEVNLPNNNENGSKDLKKKPNPYTDRPANQKPDKNGYTWNKPRGIDGTVRVNGTAYSRETVQNSDVLDISVPKKEKPTDKRQTRYSNLTRRGRFNERSN